MEAWGFKWEENGLSVEKGIPLKTAQRRNHSRAALNRQRLGGAKSLPTPPCGCGTSPELVPLGAEVPLAYPVNRRHWEALRMCKWLRFPGLTGKRGPKKPGKWPPEKKVIASYIPQHLGS